MEDPMKYLMLIYTPEASFALPEVQAQTPQILADHQAVQAQFRSQGVAWSSARLQPTASARTQVQAADGRMTHDGPFAETKEQLGGYYLVEAPDMAAAEAWAARIPQIEGGKIEIRPIMQSYD
jgi:hypothetical protein